MVSDHDRRELHSALEERLGEGPAGTLMDLLPPVGWADVARRSDITVLGAELRGEIAGLQGEIGGIKGELGGVKGELALLNARIDAQVPKLMWANVVSMFGVAGLVLAAARLA